MRNNAKQAYVTPEFHGTKVELESSFLGNSVNQVADPVSKDGNLSLDISKQGGFDESNHGFINTDWTNS